MLGVRANVEGLRVPVAGVATKRSGELSRMTVSVEALSLRLDAQQVKVST